MSNNRGATGPLGFPESGPGSLAPLLPRVSALFIDWGIALLFSQAFFEGNASVTLVFFALQTWILLAAAGATFGHLICRMRLIRLDRRPLGLWRTGLRVILLLLVIPPVVWDSDGRGLHDKIAGTALVRR